MATRIFRIFNPDAPKQDPAERRRGQLRRAQRTYRERKDQYARALEREVARARAGEADALAQLTQARQTAAALASRLVQAGLAAPDEFRDILAADGEDRRPPPVDHRHHHAPTQLRDLDPVVAGMEFVLKIEEPCLDHLACVPTGHEVNGHALTVSAHLLAVAPESSTTTATTTTTTTTITSAANNGNAAAAAAAAATTTSPTPSLPSPPSPAYNDAPVAILNRLLQLAPELVPDGDVTPVQAWRYIQTQPRFAACAAHRLHTLADRLRAAVKCHGFGAVVNMRTFEALVAETMVGER